MKTKMTVTTITKETGFGYTEEIRFCKEEFPQGGIEYYLKGYEIWEDGHRTDMPNLRYKKVTKEYGNNLYKRYIQEGYTKKDQKTFYTTEMDNR